MVFVLDVDLGDEIDLRNAEVIGNFLRRKYGVVPIRRLKMIRIAVTDPDLMARVIGSLLGHAYCPVEVKLNVFRRDDAAQRD